LNFYRPFGRICPRRSSVNNPKELVVVSSGRLVRGNTDRAFGGSSLDLLLRGAHAHAPEQAKVHSLHAHFLRAAASDIDVEVSSRVLRASRSFTTVATELTQSGRPVASGTASFHLPRPSIEHTVRATMPRSSEESAAARGGPLPCETSPSREQVDLREADPAIGADGRPVLRYWARWRPPLVTELDRAAALAWVSDLCLTRVADLEHEHLPGTRQAASLDHAMWFHRSTDVNEWLLYEVSSPSYVAELALSTGRFFDRHGVLVASVAQESMLRRRPLVRPA
jgi:acyl-CoA thioesterase-2